MHSLSWNAAWQAPPGHLSISEPWQSSAQEELGVKEVVLVFFNLDELFKKNENNKIEFERLKTTRKLYLQYPTTCINLLNIPFKVDVP